MGQLSIALHQQHKARVKASYDAAAKQANKDGVPHTHELENTDRLIGFADEHEIHFLGDDAALVSTVQKDLVTDKPDDPVELNRKMFRGLVKDQPPVDGQPHVSVSRRRYNDLVHALKTQPGADGKPGDADKPTHMVSLVESY